MGTRRQFIGSGMAVTAASLGTGSMAASSAAAAEAPIPVGLFVYQSADPTAIDAGRVMAGQGVPVAAVDEAEPVWLEQALRGIWTREPAFVVGLTRESEFATAKGLAAEFGHDLAHSAPAHHPGFVNWILGPA